MIAFLGLAHIHVPDFVNLLLAQPEPTVKWVWDHQAACQQKIAERLHCRETGSLTEVLSDPDVSAVLICSETNRHSTRVRAATTPGKDIFIEKAAFLILNRRI
jgi:1,5-anhydro-D-fructose reductase (1,5-anhydro-D-mannitol-forming)